MLHREKNVVGVPNTESVEYIVQLCMYVCVSARASINALAVRDCACVCVQVKCDKYGINEYTNTWQRHTSETTVMLSI